VREEHDERAQREGDEHFDQGEPRRRSRGSGPFVPTLKGGLGTALS